MRGYSQPIHEVRTLVDRTTAGVRHLIWEGVVPSIPARHRWYIVRMQSGALHFAYYHRLPSGPADEVPGFLATDLGVHAGGRSLGGQREECDILGATCYYRGSQPQAADLLRQWAGHDLDEDWIWEFLTGRLTQLFPDQLVSADGADVSVSRRRCASLPLRRPRRSQAQASDSN